MRRIYMLNGKEILSSECYVFLHKTRKDRECIDCESPIHKGEKYVKLNYPFAEDCIFHVSCFMGSHEDENVVGVKIVKKREFGLLRNYVICQELR